MKALLFLDVFAAAACLAIALDITRHRAPGGTRANLTLLALGTGMVLLALAYIRTQDHPVPAFWGFVVASGGTSLLVAAQIGLGTTLWLGPRSPWPARLTVAWLVILLVATAGFAALIPMSDVVPATVGFQLNHRGGRLFNAACVMIGTLVVTVGSLMAMRNTSRFVRRRLAVVVGLQVAAAGVFLVLRFTATPFIMQSVLPGVLLAATVGFVWALRHYRAGGIPSRVVRTLFDMSPVPTILLDVAAEEVVLNPIAREILGHFEPKPDSLVQALGLGQSARQVLAGGISGRRVSVPLGPSGKRVFDVQAVFHPVERTGLLLLLEATERQIQLDEVVSRIQKTRERLLVQEKMVAVGTLVAGIAHEINNPLGFLSTNLAVIEEYELALLRGVDLVRSQNEQDGQPEAVARWADSREVREAEKELPDILEECRHGCERIKRIVSALTSLSHKRGPARFADLGGLAREAVNIARGRVNSGVQLRVHVDEPLPILGISDDLTQAIVNLIINAGQAVGDRGHVTITGWRTEDTAVIEVADDGPGICHELKTRIFEPFFTTQPPGENIGLGLTFAYEVATVHTGELQVESEQGQGARFQLRIPIEKPEQAS